MRRRFDRGHAQLEHRRDLVERVVEHVLEDHAALRRGKLEKPRDGSTHRLGTRKRVFGLDPIVGRDVHGNVERFAHPSLIATQIVERAIVGNPKQPGAQGRQFLQLRQLVVCARECVLDHVLAVGDRAGRARAVAMWDREEILPD